MTAHDHLEGVGPTALVEMLDHLTDGMVVFDADWHFRYLNEPAARMLGRSREDLLGTEVWAAFPEAAGGPAYRAYEQARLENRPQSAMEYYPPVDRWFEVRLHPIGEDVVMLFRDVTELRRTAAEREEYAERMAEAERIARFGVWRWDVESGEVRWSDALQELYGLRPGEFERTVDGFVERLHPDDRERVWGVIGRAMETGEPFAFEERIRRPDGSERLLLSQGRVVAGRDGAPRTLVGVCHDITEHRTAERALAKSQRRLRAIVDNSPSVIAVKDLEGRYVMANPASGRLVGMQPQELLGTLCTDLFPPDVATQVRTNDDIAVAEERAVYDEVVLEQGGEPRTYETVTFPLPDEEGRPLEVCTIGTDVTERRERESERRTRAEWRERIERALAGDGMVLHGQRIVESATGLDGSWELLVRMRSGGDADELLLPGGFLPMAERLGLIQAIDAWVVARALELAGERRLAVNLSAVTLSDPEARRQIVGLLAAAPVAARDIVFEITETAAVEHLEAACSFAGDITALGCGLALDDFGTGFGSFTYLRRLPLRYLKIDMTFVSGLVGSVDDRRVVQSIIGIAHQFGLRTIAEGVEDQATLDLLRELGADYVQGFHLGRPAALDALR